MWNCKSSSPRKSSPNGFKERRYYLSARLWGASDDDHSLMTELAESGVSHRVLFDKWELVIKTCAALACLCSTLGDYMKTKLDVHGCALGTPISAPVEFSSSFSGTCSLAELFVERIAHHIRFLFWWYKRPRLA